MQKFIQFLFGVLSAIARASDVVNGAAGRAASFLLPLMTALTLAVVVFASVFRLGWVWMPELVVYMHAFLFMTAAADTLRCGGHVRIDLLYGRLSERGKAWINLAGVVFLLLPVCVVIALYSAPYIAASWQVREHSPEGGGLPAVFLLKTMLAVFAATMILEGLAIISRSLLTICGRS